MSSNQKIREILLVGFGDLSDFALEAERRFTEYKISWGNSVEYFLAKTKQKNVLVQPLFLLAGIKYHQLMLETERFGESAIIGKPLLTDDTSIERFAGILAKEHGNNTVLFVGHGTAHSSNSLYLKLDNELKKINSNAFVGVLSGTPSFEIVLSQLLDTSITSLTLQPLMMSVGKHVKDEIIGSGSNSWRSQVERCGITVNCVQKGLLEYSEAREMIFELINKEE
ncbi:hypothetical protein AGMMS50284_7160 [Clostridia bacterium]|nr:hypothetical protein AGMMS50284_7160 [Clostridia bacterium]